MEQWRGKVAVITGASSGIGIVLAEKMVAAGLKVVGIARRRDAIEDLADKLQAEGSLYAVKADLTNEEDVLNAFQWIKRNIGPIHILINNAGIVRISTLSFGTTQDWKDILDTNILALSIATRETIKEMRENSINGHIIHISSIAAHLVPRLPNMGMYPASKYAVKALTETLRQELNEFNSKIKISSISPGIVDTDLFKASAIASDSPDAESNMEMFMKSVPHLRAEDVSNAVLYVLGTPPNVQVHDIIIRAIGESL